ncbi:APC family permease [Pseudomonas syringae group genomosp. 3]|uniref:APC family permease n=1 Tax=Pseudomonas syringae group genomosp. 3 TaxID=251701 RepID=UPI000709DF94|nr:APC family permease [Pseudomonas syringae group genomosp. 3]
MKTDRDNEGLEAQPSNGLRRTVGLWGAVALAIGIVIGAGILALPGLVFREVGGVALLSWAMDGLLVLPLLVVLATLGRRYPSAGGVVGFVGASFPWAKAGSGYVILSAFALGLPAIAIAGSGYFVSVIPAPVLSSVGLRAHDAISLIAVFVTVFVVGTAWFGGRVASTLQNIVVTLLVACVVGVVMLSVPYWQPIDWKVIPSNGLADADAVKRVWYGMSMAFFAFTGWEVLAFTAEEFKNPKRDFPLALAISFVFIMLLYLGMGMAVQSIVSPTDPLLGVAPMMVIVKHAAGGMAALIMAVIAIFIIITNLNGAVWAASRLLFDLARDDHAPRLFRNVEPRSAVPRQALLGIGVLMILVLALYQWAWLDMSTLLRVAGQNCFLLYLASTAVYIKVMQGIWTRIFGSAAMLICLVFAAGFGGALLFAALVFVLPYVIKPVGRLLSVRA